MGWWQGKPGWGSGGLLSGPPGSPCLQLPWPPSARPCLGEGAQLFWDSSPHRRCPGTQLSLHLWHRFKPRVPVTPYSTGPSHPILKSRDPEKPHRASSSRRAATEQRGRDRKSSRPHGPRAALTPPTP